MLLKHQVKLSISFFLFFFFLTCNKVSRKYKIICCNFQWAETLKKKKLTNVILDLMLSCSKGSVHFSISYLWLHTQSIIILFPLSFMPSFSFCVFFLFFSALFFFSFCDLVHRKGTFPCWQQRKKSGLKVYKKIAPFLRYYDAERHSCGKKNTVTQRALEYIHSIRWWILNCLVYCYEETYYVYT